MKSQKNAGRRYAVEIGGLDPSKAYSFNPWCGVQRNAWGAKDIYGPQWEEGFAQGCEDNTIRARDVAEAAEADASIDHPG